MKKLITWCKHNWLVVSGCFLLAFIPLYPKLPLLDVFQTWVYIRVEDFLVALILLLFGLMLWRQKLFPSGPLTSAIIIYWAVGLVSLIVAVMTEHPALSDFRPHLGVLHFLRRVEYMGLFFVGYVAFRGKRHALPALVWTLLGTTVLIVLYGLGQKVLGFPAFLTMNEEFAKGIPLRLPPTARIPSTFGGHYDLGAFLVFVIPILGAAVFGFSKLWQKAVFFAVSVSALVLLLLTASRISFGVYLVAISVMLWWKNKRWLILPVIVVSFLLLNSVSTASERFYKTLRFSDVVIDLSTGQPIGTLETLEGGTATIEKQESPATESLPKGSEFIGIPPVAQKPAKAIKTVEVYSASPLATGSGEIATVSGSFLVQKAFVYDISITTRFQGQWPKAMDAFRRNMLLGSGYSSLNVAADGDYHRMLGETGILGAASFLGILVMAFFLYFGRGSSLAAFSDAFTTGVFAGLIGLLINALLIDVFEASKVAFPFWLLMGAAVSALRGTPGEKTPYARVWWSVITGRISAMILIVSSVFLLYGKALTLYFMGDDFTWLRWAASTLVSDIPKYFTDAGGFFYRPVPKLAYFLLYTFFWLKPWGYHLSSLLLFALIAIMIMIILERRGVRRLFAVISSLLFVSLSVHHEIVFWVSGLSGLLSTVSVVTAVAILAGIGNTKGWMKTVSWIAVVLGVGISMLSHEGGLIAPFLIWYVSWVVLGYRNRLVFAFFMLMPVYWWVRQSVGAVAPGGDYNVRMSRVFVNSAANMLGYGAAILFGPAMVERFEGWRAVARQWVPAASVAAAAGVVAVGLMYKTYRTRVAVYAHSAVWLGGAFIASLPFLGLGALTERYALLISVFIVLFIGEFLELAFRKRGAIFWIMLPLVLLLMGINVRELIRVSGDWQKASNISETTILTLKHNFFPLQDKQAFVFVNTPIRFGRAWIFPTGLEDAMWHMFKFNAYPYLLYQSSNLEDAFRITSPIGTPQVLLFEDLVLKKAVRTTQIIEVDNP